MNLHRYSESIKVLNSFVVTITAASTNGASADCLGFRRAAAIFNCTPSGAGTTGDCKLQDSADNSTFADVTSATFTQATTAGGNSCQILNIDLSKRNRYIRLVFTGAGASAAGAASGTLHLFEETYAATAEPVSAVSV